MTTTKISEALVKKFPQFSKAHDEELSEIIDALNGYSETDLELIWNEFRDTYSAGYAPRRAVFIKLAKELGVHRKAGSDRPKYEFICFICDNRFSLDLVQCPRCGNRDKTWRSVFHVGQPRIGKLKGEIDQESDERLHGIYPKNPTNDEKTNREQAAFLVQASKVGPRTARYDDSGIR